MNQFPIIKEKAGLEFRKFEFGDYLGFGACDLEFGLR
jgi:hypothetical protein